MIALTPLFVLKIFFENFVTFKKCYSAKSGVREESPDIHPPLYIVGGSRVAGNACP